MSTLLKTKHEELYFDGDWEASFGQPERNFKMFIWGIAGNGKTAFTLKLTKYLCKFGKVLYCGWEESNGSSFKKAATREKMWEVANKFNLGIKEVDGVKNKKRKNADDEEKSELEQLIDVLNRRNSAQFIVIDSLDYMGLTKKGFTKLVNLFPKKSFIVISWAEGSRPKTSAGVSVRHMCPIKVHVRDFVAYVVSRYGGNEPFEIKS